MTRLTLALLLPSLAIAQPGGPTVPDPPYWLKGVGLTPDQRQDVRSKWVEAKTTSDEIRVQIGLWSEELKTAPLVAVPPPGPPPKTGGRPAPPADPPPDPTVGRLTAHQVRFRIETGWAALERTERRWFDLAAAVLTPDQKKTWLQSVAGRVAIPVKLTPDQLEPVRLNMAFYGSRQDELTTDVKRGIARLKVINRKLSDPARQTENDKAMVGEVDEWLDWFEVARPEWRRVQTLYDEGLAKLLTAEQAKAVRVAQARRLLPSRYVSLGLSDRQLDLLHEPLVLYMPLIGDFEQAVRWPDGMKRPADASAKLQSEVEGVLNETQRRRFVFIR